MPFAPQSPLGKLLNAPMRPGRVAWIGLRPARRAMMQVVGTATLIAGQGIDGDRYASAHDGPRQVTLIAAEDIAAIASFVGREAIDPALLRRNIVTQGINLTALKERRFRIGAALLETTSDCAPCSRMEEAFGIGGYNAVRGHGGICARVIASGAFKVGDAITRQDEHQDN